MQGKNYNQYQMQMLENTQLLRQKEDQVNCNNSFGMLLSSMESLFKKNNNNITILFGHYNHFNDISWKTKQQIKEQIYTDLMAYKISKMAYMKKYGKFDYPDYPPIEEIIEIVNKWRNTCRDPEEKQLCQEILDLISNENRKPISYYQNRVENIVSYSRADPVEQFYLSNQIHNQIDKRNYDIKQKLEENPYTQFGLHMGERPGKSEFSHLQIPKSFNSSDNAQLCLEENIKELIKTLFDTLEQYLNNTKNFYLKDIVIENIKNIDKKLDEYLSKCNNIKFVYEKTEIKEYFKKIEKYKNQQSYMTNDVINLLDKIKNLFEKKNNR